MNVSLKYQKGLTFISMLFILGLIAFFTLLVLKIGPIYIDHRKVLDALLALEKTPGIEMQSEYEIRQSLQKRFGMNYVNDATKDDVTVIKSGNYMKIAIEYEVIKKIAGNLSVLVEFSDFIEVGQE
ncbi:MAG: DUF4845 domain-containing protein [Methylococcaceae bacterium]